MKTIGLIGGMSWESTLGYYKLINEAARQRLGGLHSARLVLASLDFADIERLQVDGRWDEAAQVLGCSVKSVETRLYRARQLLRARCKSLLESSAP